jgi:hypothetical protein
MTRVKARFSRAAAFATRNWVPLSAAAGAVVGGLVESGNALATGATYSIGSVVTNTQSNLAVYIPEVLAIMGALIALAWGIRFLTKHIGSAKG